MPSLRPEPQFFVIAFVGENGQNLPDSFPRNPRSSTEHKKKNSVNGELMIFSTSFDILTHYVSTSFDSLYLYGLLTDIHFLWFLAKETRRLNYE